MSAAGLVFREPTSLAYVAPIMRLLCPAFALAPTRLLSAVMREPAALPGRRYTTRRPRVVRSCAAAQPGVRFPASPYLERRVARAQLRRAVATTAPPPAEGAAAGAVCDDRSGAVAAGVGGDGGGGGGGQSDGVGGSLAAAGVYDTHEDFVAGLLAMSGDPLESSGHRVVVHRGSPKAKLMVR